MNIEHRGLVNIIYAILIRRNRLQSKLLILLELVIHQLHWFNPRMTEKFLRGQILVTQVTYSTFKNSSRFAA